MHRVLLLTLAVGCCAALGCGTTGNPPVDGGVDATEGSVEVPDISGADGADAVSLIEAEALTATLADAGDDPYFDSSRDAIGCEVTDQDPSAGEILGEGDEVTIIVDCRQVDWESREGSSWETFDAAYTAGFDDGCRALFDTSPNGSLYEDDYEYTAIDCQNLNPGDVSEASDVPIEVPDEPEAAGAELGELDGCQALFDEQGVLSLNYGTDSITVYDCPVAGYGAAVSEDETALNEPDGGPLKTGEPCPARLPDGSQVTIQVDSGKVNCSGAGALWQQFLRRAPTEGSGSGGYTEIDGWACIGATAADAPRAGSCERTDGSAAFTVYGQD